MFSHEFFHTYQFEKLKDATTYQTLASPLWFEGLATWVSSQLNPKAFESDVLMNQELATFCASQANIKMMAKEYKLFLKLNYADGRSKSIDSEWFAANGKIIPHRRGYCLGLRAIAELIKKKPITDILSMKENGFSNLLENTLCELSNF